jgi:hypothetical protein
MPAVQSAFGPIVEPGWPSTLPGSPDLAGAFLNAARIGSENNARQQRLENQLAYYAMRTQGMQNIGQMREQQFGLAQQRMQQQMENQAAALGLRQQAMDQNASFQNQRIDIGNKGMDIRQQLLDLAGQKVADRQEGSAGVLQAQQDMANQGINPGDPNYYNAFNQALIANNANKSPVEMRAAMALAARTQNSAAFNLTKVNEAEYNAFMQNYGNTVGRSKNFTDLTPILNPGAYQPETKTTGGFLGFGGTTTPTGNITIPLLNAQGRQVGKNAVPASTLADLNAQYQAIMQRRNQIPHRINDPSLGVSDVEPMPPKALMQVNHKYQTKFGPMQWDGAQLQPITGGNIVGPGSGQGALPPPGLPFTPGAGPLPPPGGGPGGGYVPFGFGGDPGADPGGLGF